MPAGENLAPAVGQAVDLLRELVPAAGQDVHLPVVVPADVQMVHLLEVVVPADNPWELVGEEQFDRIFKQVSTLCKNLFFQLRYYCHRKTTYIYTSHGF